MHYQHTLLGSLVDGDVTLIPLRNREKQVVAYAMIDTADARWAEQWRWHRTKTGYVARSTTVAGRAQTVFLHREVLGLPWAGREPQGDHINHDPLDNRRANLRLVSARGNAQNQRAHGGVSQYRGVCWHRIHRCWQATGRLDNRAVLIGSYHTEEEAARAAACWRAIHYPTAVEDPALLAAGPPVRLGKARGERIGISRLTEPQVREMRARYAAGGVAFQALAQEYGVTKATVRRLVRGHTWRHVD
jgi:hypothetical protein